MLLWPMANTPPTYSTKDSSSRAPAKEAPDAPSSCCKSWIGSTRRVSKPRRSIAIGIMPPSPAFCQTPSSSTWPSRTPPNSSWKLFKSAKSFCWIHPASNTRATGSGWPTQASLISWLNTASALPFFSPSRKIRTPFSKLPKPAKPSAKMPIGWLCRISKPPKPRPFTKRARPATATPKPLSSSAGTTTTETIFPPPPIGSNKPASGLPAI
jgi:hypothetical protein